jgi:hypothetical protein
LSAFSFSNTFVRAVDKTTLFVLDFSRLLVCTAPADESRPTGRGVTRDARVPHVAQVSRRERDRERGREREPAVRSSDLEISRSLSLPLSLSV